MQKLIDSLFEKELYKKENDPIEADAMSSITLASPKDIILNSITRSTEERKYFYPSPSDYFVCGDFVENYDLYKEPEKEKEPEKNEEKEDEEEEEERLFTCELCKKTYLSQSALYTHNKIKHDIIRSRIPSDPSKKPRGRPRKEEIPLESQIYYDPKSVQFFLKSDRVGTVEYFEYSECINDAFEKLYGEKNTNYKKIFDILKLKDNNINSHSFFGKWVNDSHDKYKIIMNLDVKMDKIFINYLNRISLYCTPEYYTKVICCISLF